MDQFTLGVLLLDTGARDKSSFLNSFTVGNRSV